MAERCELTELLVDQCGHCNGAEKRASEVEHPERGPWFTARYTSMCGGCFGRIDPGGKIRADGDGAYLCEDCGDGEAS